MPRVRKPQATSVHTRVRLSHSEPGALSMRADMANANGTAIPTYPKYSIGGWIAIRMWFCRSGFGPRPSSEGSDSAHGQLLPSKHPTMPG